MSNVSFSLHGAPNTRTAYTNRTWAFNRRSPGVLFEMTCDETRPECWNISNKLVPLKNTQTVDLTLTYPSETWMRYTAGAKKRPGWLCVSFRWPIVLWRHRNTLRVWQSGNMHGGSVLLKKRTRQRDAGTYAEIWSGISAQGEQTPSVHRHHALSNGSRFPPNERTPTLIRRGLRRTDCSPGSGKRTSRLTCCD